MTVRVAIFLDRDRRREEEVAFSRLAVGLAADGTRSTLVLAADAEDDPRESPETVEGPIPTIQSPMDLPFWIRRRLATAILDRIEDTGFGRPDVIVACGRGCLALAATSAELLEIPLVAEVRDRREVDAAVRIPSITVIAATSNLRHRAARKIGEDRTTSLPIPVPRIRASHDRDRGLLVALGPVGDLNAWKAMIDGLAGPGGILPGMQHLALGIGLGQKDASIWRRLRGTPMADHMSSFDHTDHMRPLLAGADVILAPDRDQAIRSIELQARISGGVVIAADDRLRDDRSEASGDRLLTPAEARQSGVWREATRQALLHAPSLASASHARSSLVSNVAPRWAAVLETIVHGDATPIGHS